MMRNELNKGLTLAVLILLAGATAASAHEPTVVPIKRREPRPMLLIPGVTGTDHLVASPAALDFGPVTVGQAVTRAVTLTNASARAVTVGTATPAGISVSPAQVSLVPGAAASLQVTYTAAASGTFSGVVDLLVDHDEVNVSHHEALPFSGVAAGPPHLEVVAVETAGFDAGAGRIDIGLVALEPQSYDTAPSFEVTIANTGGSVAHNVSVAVPGPGAIIAQRACTERAEASVCVQSAAGTPPTGLGDLEPGETLITTWSVLPYSSGAFDYGSFLLQADLAASTVLEVTGEVIPFTLPEGRKMLPLSEIEELTEKFGESTDPLGTDPLAELRVTGFDARTVFSVGEVDSVDLRTGNLTLVVPIGSEQPVRGPLSYALNAVYNSTLWYRKTLAEYESEGPGPTKPITALWPDPSFNLVGGWSFHLGRLLPPRVLSGQDPIRLCQSADPLGWEDELDTGPRFVYLDSSGTQHPLYRHLHGDEYQQGDEPFYDDVDPSYSRDGSLLRMVKEGEDVRWIEEQGGLRRRFQRRGTGSPVLTTPTLPDEWLLTRIEDRYGNVVQVVYQGTEWRIRDTENTGGSAWREVVVSFTDWTGRDSAEPLVVDKVTLPGFAGGAARVYDFQYLGDGGGTSQPGSLTLNREHRSPFHSVARLHCAAQGYPPLDTTVRLPRLDRIVQPDGQSWAFSYDTSFSAPLDDLRLDSVVLPSGGEIDYQYEKAWDAAASCRGNAGLRDRVGVSRRTVKGVGGTSVLEDLRYLRQLEKTDDVPLDICQTHYRPIPFDPVTGEEVEPPNTGIRPFSQQVVGVWRHDRTEGSTPHTTLTLHHFNVWPYDDTCSHWSTECPVGGNCCTGGHLTSGRTNRERNVMSDPSRKDPVGQVLELSTETFTCQRSLASPPGFDLGGNRQGDRIHELTADPACSRQETRYAKYEVEATEDCRFTNQDEFMNCLLDSRVRTDKTVFANDGNRWVRTDRSDYDGLGHFREEVTSTGAWGANVPPPAKRTSFTRYNPAAGTLLLNPDHSVAQDIALPATWILGSYAEHWVEEGSVYRGGEACFDPVKGQLTYERSWTCKAANGYSCAEADDNDGTLIDVRSSDDLVVRHLYTSQGERTSERHYGANTLAVPTGDNWCNDANWGGAAGSAVEQQWAAGHVDYTVRREYDYGVLARQFVVGNSVYEANRQIDRATGWSVSETLNNGEGLTYRYDPLGRITWITSDRTASQRFAYTRPAGQGWKLTADLFPKNTGPGTTASPVRSYIANYDGLGRLAQETLPTYNGSATRTVAYHPSGEIASVSALDDPARSSRLTYDYRGRPIEQVAPDGVSTTRFDRSGIRLTVQRQCVKTGVGTGSGLCAGSGLQEAAAELVRDPFDRVIQQSSPEGVVTRYTYDPLDNRLSAVRTDGGITQTRTWSYDGRGFLRSEVIPERSVTALYSNFNTRGLARTAQDKAGAALKRSAALSYDPLGRLLGVDVGGKPITSFSYCGPAQGCAGPEPRNGQLLSATRYNRRDATSSGAGQAGAWLVASSFGYDAAGRRSSRTTGLTFDPDQAGQPNSATTQFQQFWAYDDYDNLASMSYPSCIAGAEPGSDRSLVAWLGYVKGFYLTTLNAQDAAGTQTEATLTYHKSGLVHQVQHHHGAGTDTYGVAAGMPRIASMSLAGGALNLGNVAYDRAGNIVSIGGGTGVVDAFTYDRDSRLTAATVRGASSSFSYAYDGFDNITNLGTVDRQHNQLTGGGWSYDDFGNLEAGAGYSLVYDELDKLADMHSGGNHQLSLYDHDDLRVLSWDQPTGELTWRLRDGLRVVREFVGFHGHVVPRTDYLYAGSRLISSRLYPSGAERHYHADQVGSTRWINGASTAAVSYGPFGESLGAASNSGEPVVGFQGHENDGLTTYMRGRQYYNQGGRFLQVDPAREGWNAYSFGGNNPIGNIDPSGLWVFEVSVAATARAGFGLGMLEVGLVFDTSGNGGVEVTYSGPFEGGGAIVDTDLSVGMSNAETIMDLEGDGLSVELDAGTAGGEFSMSTSGDFGGEMSLLGPGIGMGVNVTHTMVLGGPIDADPKQIPITMGGLAANEVVMRNLGAATDDKAIKTALDLLANLLFGPPDNEILPE